MVRKLVKRLVRGSGRLGMFRGQSHKKQQKVSLKKLERTQRIRRERLEKVAYDPKSIEKFGGIVEQIEIIFSFEMIN